MRILAALALLLAGSATAQTPDDRWRTVETESFRVHYPVQAEEWALDAASQLDDIRRRVVAEVGYEPPQKVDVVIVDPYTMANGSAWPFLGGPRMLLWATPPGSDSVIGHYRTWTELLLTHEDTHLVHLLRPSRNPFFRGVDVALGLGPVARKAPRWVTEGYATVVEARLTGYGRPNSDFRALLLRELSREGRMPTYGELDSFDRFMGGGFAYLVGSAYLEWLEARGPGTLTDLWARLTAREDRSFDEAFIGVFGEPPASLYARFVAEITHASLEIEQARPVGEETLWMDLRWGTGAPAVSPGGDMIAAVVHSKDGPPRLRVWATAVDEEAVERREEEIAEQLEADPQDVPPVEGPTEPHELLYERLYVTRNPVQPRWMPDGSALLFTAWQWDGEGRFRPDLFLWEPVSGAERRVTDGKDVRSADPSSDGTFAVAVQHDWGRTRLVTVALDTGEVEPLTDFDVDVVYDEPRLSPDGARVAWLEQRGRGWDVVIRDLEEGTVTRLRRGGEGGPTFQQLAWSPDGRKLYASVGEDGFVEVREVLDLDGPLDPITRTRGGATSPAPSADGWLYHLSMDADGFDLHRAPLEAVEPDLGIEGMVPVVRPPTPEPVSEPERVTDLQPEPYGLGRTELRPLIGGTWSDSQGALELGLRAGDLVGRHDLLLMGSWGGQAGVTGALLGGTYRGLPVDPTVEAFIAIEGFDVMQRYGAAGRLERSFGGNTWGLGLALGGWVDAPIEDVIRTSDEFFVGDEVIPPGVVIRTTPDRQVGWADLDLALIEGRGGWLGGGAEGRVQLGNTGDDGWKRLEGTARLWVGRGPTLRAAYTYGWSDTFWGLDQYRLGGVPSAVLPTAWQWQRITSPGFEVGLLRGQARDEVRVSYDTQFLSVFGERHRMGDQALPERGATLAGIGSSIDLEEQSFAKLPALRASAGVGCVLEHPSAGWDPEPCDDLDDWSLWATLNWQL